MTLPALFHPAACRKGGHMLDIASLRYYLCPDGFPSVLEFPPPLAHRPAGKSSRHILFHTRIPDRPAPAIEALPSFHLNTISYMAKKGRSRELIAKRDQMLCRRYHYWTEIARRRFDDTLRILSEEEFFLSEERILVILRRNSDLLHELSQCVNKRKHSRSTARKSLFIGQ